MSQHNPFNQYIIFKAPILLQITKPKWKLENFLTKLEQIFGKATQKIFGFVNVCQQKILY